MTKRNLVLGSAAGFAIAAALASFSYAQSLPRYPAPTEQAQTEALNAQQANQPSTVIASTETITTGVPPAIAVYNAQVAQSNAQARADYQAELKDYQQKRSDYDAQNRAFEDQLSQYNSQALEPPQHEIIIEHASPLVEFRDLRNPDREAAGLPVRDRIGNMVGRFEHLTFQDAGREEAVISLHNNRTIVLDDRHLQLDPDHDTVVADLSYDELNRMPSRF